MLGAFDDKNFYITPEEAKKNVDYYCIECKEKLIFKHGQIKRPHFSHYKKTNCTYYDHPNESQEHKDSKLRLKYWLENKFTIQVCILGTDFCSKCNCIEGALPLPNININYKDGDNIELEYKSEKFIADVALLNNNKLKYIFEVKHTHKTCTNRTEPWYEFNTKDILHEHKYDENKIIRLNCIRREKNLLCELCSIYEEDWIKNLPPLDWKNGNELGWKQILPCIKCGRHEYNPVFSFGYKQICKICLCEHKHELRNEYLHPKYKRLLTKKYCENKILN